MSIVEFVGCLAALGGGIVLGSIYLGVDVKAMAVVILEQADIAVPAILETESTPNNAPPTAATTDEFAEQPASSAESFSDELPAEDAEQPQDAAAEPTESPSLNNDSKQLTQAEQLAATKACWSELSEAMREELANRSKSIRDPGNWQLFDYLLNRQQGHAKVVDTIENLDLNGVDQRLNAHVHQVLTWHRSGANLFDRAAQLLTDAPAGKLSGPFAQSWQSASTQHRMEEKLILNKHKAVASYLEHTQKAAPEGSASK